MKKVKGMYVIDDDKIYHFLLKNLFKQNNIEADPKFYGNGLDAIESLKKIPVTDPFPELILLDVNMPIMDGWQFLEEYVKLSRDMGKTSTIFMISSSNDEHDLSKARQYSNVVRDYLLKPICKEDLEKIFLAVGVGEGMI
ncbi:response regulator [Flavobacterium sp. RNTU_13]|uniref:response regulator n=1 Tax=Flavobacterium sp. RNTU_13 TaxID=3375145 RepID=UPI003988323A